MAQENVKKLQDKVIADNKLQVQDQKLPLDELDNVAGGTLREVNELSAAFRQSKVSDYRKLFWAGESLEAILDKIGIVARTSEGFCGIGAGSVNNTYKEKSTGKMILHEEVIEYIRTGRKTW